MAKVWQLKAPKRTWRQVEDVVPLLEPCKVFPELNAKAAILLAQAPVKDVGPGVVPLLYEQPWTRTTLESWLESPDASRLVKQAIEQAKKGAR